MKKEFLSTTLLLSAFSLAVGVSLLKGNETTKAQASSYSTRSVPTTIDLNDASASTIRSYYSSLNNLSTSERQGTNLLKNLKPILKNNQKYFSYGGSATTAVWKAYEIVDRDWEKSPASAISGYNAQTNKITGYTYGSSVNGDKGTNPYIHALYINRNVDNQTRAWDDHQQTQWGINQEHIWAKSCGFEEESPSAGARGDLMHLWAGNGRVNGDTHSNYYYGYVDTTKSYNDAGSYASNLSGNKRGTSKTFGGSKTVFEPQDSDKGDIARAIFYMAARYNYYSGSDSDGIDAGNPNLELVNNVSSWQNSGYQSSTSVTGKMGILQDLLEWNRLDPPDSWEIHRNNILYNSFTNNRNPFIDFPEWAEFIWGKSTNGSYSSTSTGYATPTSDTINDFGGGGVIPPVEKTLSSISISDQKTSFTVGDTFSFGGTVTAHYSDSTTADVTGSATFSGYNMSTTGNQTVTVSYTEGGATKTTTYQITVSEPPEETDFTWNLAIASYNDNPTVDLVVWSHDVMEMRTARTDSTKTAANNYLGGDANSRTSSRFYTGNSLIFAPSSGYEITSVVFNATSSAYATALANSSWTNASASSSNTIVTITPTDGTSVFSAVIGGTCGATAVTVNYASGAPVVVPTSIEAEVEKEFNVGETITKSDITVTDNLGNDIDDFEFEDYQFTYGDAASGGVLTDKVFVDAITYNEMTCSVTAQVKRMAHEEVESAEDTLDRAFTGVTGTTYTSWSNKAAPNSSAVYAGQSAGGNTSIQLRSDNSNSGIITTTSGGNISSVSVTWNASTANGRTLNVYGKNTAYSSPSDLYGNNSGTLLGTIVKGTSTSLEITGDYTYVGVRSNSGAMYLTDITFTYGSSDTAVNVANYIMFSDTNNQCNNKFSVAKEYFTGLSTSERSTFMTSNSYVISTARTRLEAWATNKGETISYVDGDYVIKKSRPLISGLNIEESDKAPIIIVIVSFISLTSISGYIFIKRKKEI